MSGFVSGSCPVRVWFISGFVSGSYLGSCPVRGRCLVRVCFGFGSGLGSYSIRIWFVSGSCSVVFGSYLLLDLSR